MSAGRSAPGLRRSVVAPSCDAPSVKRARPPVGWHRTALQEPQRTTVWL